MTDAIGVALIAAFSAIFGGVVTQLFTHYNTRFNMMRPKRDVILEKQLFDVIAPIHKIIINTKGLDINQQEQIESIIYTHHAIAPQPVIDSFYEIVKTPKVKLTKAEIKNFVYITKQSFSISRSKLGYTQVKVKKSNKDIERSLAKSRTLFPLPIFIIIMLLAISLINMQVDLANRKKELEELSSIAKLYSLAKQVNDMRDNADNEALQELESELDRLHEIVESYRQK